MQVRIDRGESRRDSPQISLSTHCQHRALGLRDYLRGEGPWHVLRHRAFARSSDAHYNQVDMPFPGEAQNAFRGEIEPRDELRFTLVLGLRRHQEPHRFPGRGLLRFAVLGRNHWQQLQENQVRLILFR